MPAVTIAFCNLKGGVGKTSTTFHLGGTLAKDGYEVLLIDADPQASLTQGFFGANSTQSIAPEDTVTALFGDSLLSGPSDLIQGAGYPGLSIVRGSMSLARYNVAEPWRAEDYHQAAFRDFVAEVGESYDFILIDCPPNLGLCAWAAMVASDHLVVPLQAEDFGSQGLSWISGMARSIQEGPNPGLNIAGYLLTMFNPKFAIHASYAAILQADHGDLIFSTTIPLATDFKVAVASRIPIAFYKGKSAAAKSIKALADELVARMGCTAVPKSRRVA